MNDVYLLLGSNLGDRKLFMQRAIEDIEKSIAPIVKASPVYETQSWGKTDAPDYLNQVIMLQTAVGPHDLLKKILEIETALGRKRDEKWGARTFDIDILFYGSAIIDEPGLQIPHPQLHNRRFTLAPLSDIAPDFMHPVLLKSTVQLKNELTDNLVVKKI